MNTCTCSLIVSGGCATGALIVGGADGSSVACDAAGSGAKGDAVGALAAGVVMISGNASGTVGADGSDGTDIAGGGVGCAVEGFGGVGGWNESESMSISSMAHPLYPRSVHAAPVSDIIVLCDT